MVLSSWREKPDSAANRASASVESTNVDQGTSRILVRGANVDRGAVVTVARRVGVETFDEQPVPDLDSEAIDFVTASMCRRSRRPGQ